MLRTSGPDLPSAPYDVAPGTTPLATAPEVPLDPERVRRLVTEHLGPVTRFLGRVGVPPGEVDDVAQESFLVACSKMGDVPRDRERAFLLTVVAHVAQNARRASFRRNRAYATLMDIEPDASPSQEDLTDRLRARALADSVLREMGPELRGVFVLCELEGMAVPEVAARLALPTGTAASRLRRARKTFLERFARASSPHRHRGTNVAGVTSSPEILSWWASAGERDALQAVADIYRDTHPGSSVVFSTIRETQLAKNSLSERMASDSPPDTFQANGGRDLHRWSDGGSPSGSLEPIEFLFERAGLRSVFPPEILDLVSWGGEAYAVPLNIHRINSLFCDSQTFARLGLRPPQTLSELHDAARAMRARGVAPLALGAREPWVLSMLAFEYILVALAGPDFYRDFFEGRGSPGAPEIRAAIEELGALLDQCNPDVLDLSWDAAADRLRVGGAAMTLMGDWTKGFYGRRGYREGEGYIVGPSPGTDGAFVFTIDAFGLPQRAPHRAAAIELLDVFGSRQAQSVFSRLKGSRPARSDVSVSPREDASQAQSDFGRARRVPTLACMVPSGFSQVMDAGMAEYARTRSVSTLLSLLDRHYRSLQP